jgi:hypothetical protein
MLGIILTAPKFWEWVEYFFTIWLGSMHNNENMLGKIQLVFRMDALCLKNR